MHDRQYMKYRQCKRYTRYKRFKKSPLDWPAVLAEGLGLCPAP